MRWVFFCSMKGQIYNLLTGCSRRVSSSLLLFSLAPFFVFEHSFISFCSWQLCDEGVWAYREREQRLCFSNVLFCTLHIAIHLLLWHPFWKNIRMRGKGGKVPLLPRRHPVLERRHTLDNVHESHTRPCTHAHLPPLSLSSKMFWSVFFAFTFCL